MGLLDDAIREHLELKRRRGADPAEVAEQEREALGPVRGGAATAAAAPADDSALAEPEPEAAAVEPPAPEPEAPPPPVHDESVPAHDEPPPTRLAHDEPPPAPPRDAPAPPSPASREDFGQPTEQYSVEELEALGREDDEEDDDVVPADEEPGAEDVLDETPEFLQEAPEHDRLWFEQKPPRDFDF